MWVELNNNGTNYSFSTDSTVVARNNALTSLHYELLSIEREVQDEN